METTPKFVTDTIIRFCRSLEPEATPVMVPVRPRDGALPEDCFFNVFDAISDLGGSPQYGWIIWERPGVVLSAEFHSVWRGAGGLIDITPHDGEQEILFLPSTREYAFRRVKPVRLALSNNGLVSVLCRTLDELFDLMEPHFIFPATKGGATFAVPPSAEPRILAAAQRVDDVNRKLRRVETRRRR